MSASRAIRGVASTLKGLTQEQLLEQRAAHPEIDETVIAIRADTVSGGSEYKKTGENDITRLLIKSQDRL